MKTTTTFNIYNASAGSGKTFTLVKQYLKQLFLAPSASAYKNLLAITFTNKAVAEMKHRIVSSLVLFSEEKNLEEIPAMLEAIAEETGLSVEAIQKKASLILKNLLHNYASFSVETIDRFNHQLIRTFARDLALSSNFEVTLDTNLLLEEAVEQLISKAGEHKKTTDLLLDFVLEKIDDDRSWDISRDIAKAASILYNENELAYLSSLKEKTVDDFLLFKKQLLEEKQLLEKEITSIAARTLELMEQSGLEFSDFSGQYFPKFLQKLFAKNFNVSFGLAWQDTIGEKPMYPSRLLKESSHAAAVIDELTPTFLANFLKIKTLITRVLLIDNILVNLTPLSVINLVKNEIEILKEEQNILPIAEFNALINKEIKNQPAPFIYERLGERYRHYFIDEFQDTSLYQWENLKPLIENALTQQDDNGEPGSLLLVGDTKQSIYRWRGGLPEQFLALCNDHNPFPVEKTVINLPTNFRSFKNIVSFNNAFFSHIADYLNNNTHQELYKVGNQQNQQKQGEGYVELSFLQMQNSIEKDEMYGTNTLAIIKKCIESGFDYKDICILTRRKKDGIAISTFLLENKVPVISQETLLLKYSKAVNCVVSILQLLENPKSNLLKKEIVLFVYQHLNISLPKHDFLNEFIHLSLHNFSKKLNKFGIAIDFKSLENLSVYEKCEYCIEALQINTNSDAYIFSFMDFVFEFEQQPNTVGSDFITYWDSKKDSASVTTGASLNAVQIMTIHKSKGLEFPVVIFPYADVAIYKEIEPKVWYPLAGEKYNFTNARITFKKEVSDYSSVGEVIYSQRQQTLELDNYNLLYVTLTRAVEQLYILCEASKTSKNNTLKDYNNLFVSFLKEKGKWDASVSKYHFGTFQSKQEKNIEEVIPQLAPVFKSSAPEKHNLSYVTTKGSLWLTDVASAIDFGNQVHNAMAQIKTSNDLAIVLDNIPDENKALRNTLNNIVNHPELTPLFSENSDAILEQDIFTENGVIIRPDRINIHPNNYVTIVDYKTGEPSNKNIEQIEGYALVLERIGYTVKNKLLVYVSESEILVNNL